MDQMPNTLQLPSNSHMNWLSQQLHSTKVVLRESDENAALQAASALQKGMVADLTPKLAISASKLSLQHSLPMADAIILATAQAHGATLWTQDIHFKGIHGIKYFPKK